MSEAAVSVSGCFGAGLGRHLNDNMVSKLLEIYGHVERDLSVLATSVDFER